MNVKRTILALLLLAACWPAAAQDYQQQAGMHSTLYRGKLPKLYPYKYNGTYYLESRQFSRGSILYNGKVYDNVLLNLDAFTQNLEVKPDAKIASVILDRSQVVWFTLNGARFVNLQYLGYPEAREGFYEVVRDGKEPLLRFPEKVFKTDSQGNSVNRAGMDGNFDPEVINYFASEETWYTLADGELKKLSRRALRKKQAEPAGDATESPLANAAWHPLKETAAGTVPALNGRFAGVGLPDGYFEEKLVDTTTVEYAANALTATYRNKIYEIGQEGKASGGKAVVSGTVFEAESGLPLPGVVIFDENTATYVRSDARGRYRITLPLGENLINYNAESKEDLTLKLDIRSDGDLDVVMTEKILLLKGAIVSAESMRQHRTTVMGVESVSMNTLGKIPSAFGEGDIIKAVLTLPGVKSVGEASGGFNVRGGSADQNLVLYNDNTIYNPSHLFGMFSAFNPDLVDQVELYKSSIPAQYGGRISSVLSVSSKEGDRERVKGSLGIGLLTSRGHIEGPIGDKTSFVLGARTTYSDWMLKLFPDNSAYAGGGASFTDANLGVTHHFDDKHSLQAFGYYATDRFSFSGDTTFRYANLNASLAYRYKGDDGQTAKISAGYDQYRNIVGAHEWKSGAYNLTTYIRQAFLKAGMTLPVGSHAFSYGVDVTGYLLDPGILAPFGEDSQVVPTSLERDKGIEGALYVSDDWTITEQFSVDAGVRYSSFLALNPAKYYGGPEVRVSAKYSPARNLSFKAGFNSLRQYIHLISNTASVSPMDTWRLSSAHIAPTTGWQGAAGAYWTLLGVGVDLSLEGYYKDSRNGLDYKNGAMLSMNPYLHEDLVPVQGRAYGVEFMVKKPAGRLTGWFSYSYSRSLLRETSERSAAEAINKGAWYNAPYDKPHEFKLAGNFAITHRYSISVNVDYSTGRPTTIPVGRYYFDGAWRLAYSERNSYRIPDYFRIDAALNIDPGHYIKAFAHTSITLGVYNVTGRKNAYSVFFRTTPAGNVNGYLLSVFAVPIPYVNLNILF